MHSEVFSFGPLIIRSYGLMLAIGFMSGILLAAHRAKKIGENPDHIYNLSAWIVLSALFGARLYYVITHYREFRADASVSGAARLFTELKNMFWPIGADGQVGISGLILYGGLIAATITTTFYLKKHKLSIPRFLDILGPSMGIGEFFTRIGCFLNGCCWGKPTDSWCGVVFPDHSAAGFYFSGIHLHPSQIYNALAGLFIFIILLTAERWKKFDGFTALLYFMLYAIGRFTIDYSRYYESRLKLWGLSQNQILSLIVFLTASGIMLFMMKRSARRESLTE